MRKVVALYRCLVLWGVFISATAIVTRHRPGCRLRPHVPAAVRKECPRSSRRARATGATFRTSACTISVWWASGGTFARKCESRVSRFAEPIKSKPSNDQHTERERDMTVRRKYTHTKQSRGQAPCWVICAELSRLQRHAQRRIRADFGSFRDHRM